jgi:hypothetical protein
MLDLGLRWLSMALTSDPHMNDTTLASQIQLREIVDYLAYRNLLHFLRKTGAATNDTTFEVLWGKRP